jgi:hypothetical protein
VEPTTILALPKQSILVAAAGTTGSDASFQRVILVVTCIEARKKVGIILFLYLVFVDLLV